MTATDVRILARNLVSIPSHDDETAAGDAIEAWLRKETDAAVTRDGAGNVFARKGSGPSLALVGHHDVVPPADEQVADGEYAIEERDGRLYGRGTADMKGALAAMLCAFRDSEVPRTSESRTESGDSVAQSATDHSSGARFEAEREANGEERSVSGLRPRDSDPVGELVFASFVGEESGGIGARHAIEDGFAPDYAVVGEGSTNYSGEDVMDMAVAHKGRRGSPITARGTAAHASEPDAGENAIQRACDAVGTIGEMGAPTTEVFGNELSGSVAVTQIDGGSAMNTIPERCRVTVDERTVPGERVPLERVTDSDGVEWSIDQDLPPMYCSDEAFAERMLGAARDAQAGTPELVAKPHATDAGWLAEAGTTCVVCGAAEPGEAHTDDESVSLAALDRCYRLYREAVARVV